MAGTTVFEVGWEEEPLTYERRAAYNDSSAVNPGIFMVLVSFLAD